MKKQISILALSIALLTTLSSTRIHSAAEQPTTNAEATRKLHKAIIDGNEPLACEAIKENADIHTSPRYGHTPLWQATWHGCTATVRVLLEHKADPNKQNGLNDNHPALIWAVRRNYSAIVHMLLEHKADPNIQDMHQFTPLLYTTFYSQPDLIEPLILHGADLDIKTPREHRALDFATSATKKMLLNALHKKVAIDLSVQNWELKSLVELRAIEQFVVPELASLICAYADPYYTASEPLHGIIKQYIQNNIKQTQVQLYATTPILTCTPADIASARELANDVSSTTHCVQELNRTGSNKQKKTTSCGPCILS